MKKQFQYVIVSICKHEEELQNSILHGRSLSSSLEMHNFSMLSHLVVS